MLTNCRRIIATCGDDYSIKIWRIPVEFIWDKTKTGKSKVSFRLQVQCAKFERSLIQSVSFANQEASIVAASCIDGTVRLFDTKIGLVMLTVNCPGVTRIAVSRNYEYLAIATNSGRCCVYTLHGDEKTQVL
jgi:WD40 repeat protein